MKFSYNWLQEYFDQKLPAPEVLGDLITFHSSEIEELVTMEEDVAIDVKILPDKSAWLMSHRGLAKEISVILNQSTKSDPFQKKLDIKNPDQISIERKTENCDYYSAALITGIKVGPSPEWMVKRLATLGQRSINNIVDATNYVMFELGQPLHAFAADKLDTIDNNFAITIRNAKAGEKITVLTGEEFTLAANDAVITDQVSGKILGIAGVKGGQAAAVDLNTTTVILESAHFDRKQIRQTAKNLKLPTDAAKRFENGIKSAIAPIALARLIDLILEVAGGEVVAINTSGEISLDMKPVVVTLTKINSLLGLELSMNEVTAIFDRYHYAYHVDGEQLTVIPPFERDDLVLAEDVIEEVGRMYGLDKIKAIPPAIMSVTQFNARHYYSEKIRQILVGLGFSEVYTSSFRAEDQVKLANALASDKGYLRSTLVNNLKEARIANIPHRDLLGLAAVKIFEIGTVFSAATEECRVALAVQTGTAYKAKVDEPLVVEALEKIKEALGVELKLIYQADGVVEFSLDELLHNLPIVTKYEINEVTDAGKSFHVFSTFPSTSRDVAMWVGSEVTVDQIENLLRAEAGSLCVRVTHLDTFSKEGRTSFAFRLVFQSFERTLTDLELEPIMDKVYQSIKDQGWEAR
jgi:phenylalanyl-tRNA synthetase beta chain